MSASPRHSFLKPPPVPDKTDSHPHCAALLELKLFGDGFSNRKHRARTIDADDRRSPGAGRDVLSPQPASETLRRMRLASGLSRVDRLHDDLARSCESSGSVRRHVAVVRCGPPDVRLRRRAQLENCDSRRAGRAARLPDPPHLRTVAVTRYVTPLREGGSVPAIVEADDEGMYVLKFRGAGQGPKALIAELVAGEIARAAGLPVPEIVFIELDPDLARTEPDPETAGSDPRQRRAQRRARLPAGRRDVRSGRAPPGRAARLCDRVVRRLRHQRRSHRAQHQHAHVASSAPPDRPRRGAVLPSFLGRTTWSAAAIRFPADQGSRAAAVRDAPCMQAHERMTRASRLR